MPQHATERVVALMTQREKSRLKKRAAEFGLPVGELIRRAVAAYDPDQAQREG